VVLAIALVIITGLKYITPTPRTKIYVSSGVHNLKEIKDDY